MAELNAAPAELRILPAAGDVARVATDLTIAVLARGIAEHGIAHLALTGGSSAVPLFKELARPERRAQLDWQNVHLWWGDERFVPLDHPESNSGLADRLLLGIGPRSGDSVEGAAGTDVEAGVVRGLMVDPDHVHPVEVAQASDDPDGPGRAAAAYAAEIKRWLPLTDRGTPIFDVILNGIGPDGHLMSIFPGSPALAPDAPVVMGIAAPQHVEPHLRRVTLSARVLPAARRVMVMAIGRSKADIVHDVLGPRRDPQRWPVQSALLANAVWLLDREAIGDS